MAFGLNITERLEAMHAAPAQNDPVMDDSVAALEATLALQRAACLADPTPGIASRRRDLKALRAALGRWQDALSQAMSEDFGGRSDFECKMLDVLAPAVQIDHALCAPEELDWRRAGAASTGCSSPIMPASSTSPRASSA